MFPPAILLPIIELLRSCLMGVMGPLGDRTRKAPSMGLPAGRLIPEPLVVLIQAWLQKRRQTIEALMHRIAAGTHVPRPYRPREPRPDAVAQPRAEPPPDKQLPRGFAWINAVASEINVHANALGHLIANTEMKAMILASPQMARTWAPLLNALGQTRPNWWPKPPTRPRRPRKPRPKPTKTVLAGPDPAAASFSATPPPRAADGSVWTGVESSAPSIPPVPLPWY